MNIVAMQDPTIETEFYLPDLGEEDALPMVVSEDRPNFIQACFDGNLDRIQDLVGHVEQGVINFGLYSAVLHMRLAAVRFLAPLATPNAQRRAIKHACKTHNWGNPLEGEQLLASQEILRFLFARVPITRIPWMPCFLVAASRNRVDVMRFLLDQNPRLVENYALAQRDGLPTYDDEASPQHVMRLAIWWPR